jgi:2'-5' RNA ligase
VPTHNLHVTLAFLGSVPERRLGELGEIARAAALRADFVSMSSPADPQDSACESAGFPASAGPQGSRLEIAFDRLEHWRDAHLVCALPAEPPAAVVSLARRLQDRLGASGFASDLKSSWPVGVKITKPFRPHVTLARKVHRPPRIMEMQPVTWSFTDYVLVESETLPDGSVYTILERFSLAR